MLKDKILKNYEKLNKTDLDIWNFIENHKKAVTDYTINELADALHVSRTTITRFIKKIDLRGYSEFKVLLDMENQFCVSEISYNEYNNFFTLLTKYIDLLKNKDFEHEISMIESANNIFSYGTGDIQTAVAEELRRMFLSTGKLIYVLGDKTLNKNIFNAFKEKDLIIIISLSGNNKEAVNMAKAAKLSNAKVLSITDIKNNSLTSVSDHSIFIDSPEINFLQKFPNYQFTSLYFILAEILFIKYSIKIS